MKKWCLAFFLVSVGWISLQAATVSVLVVETGLPPGTGPSPSASIWESGIMDAFFDAGHIVSNAPILQIPDMQNSEMPPEARREFDQARIGGADFFVMVLLSYPADSLEHPKEVSIRLFSVSTGKMIYQTSLTVQVWENPEEEFRAAKRNGGRIIPQLSTGTRTGGTQPLSTEAIKG
jgi:hypothetical protein